jgi:hypothetical protein
MNFPAFQCKNLLQFASLQNYFIAFDTQPESGHISTSVATSLQINVEGWWSPLSRIMAWRPQHVSRLRAQNRIFIYKY